jgi:type VI secretion system protein ImpM
VKCGLFGKLGAKRDFVALATPRGFLERWEPWMQASLSASRDQLGDRWQQAYLTAPIWRFWLGASICGTPVAGAIMPSLDGVGRYYPLTVHAVSEVNAPIAPPEMSPQDGWFGQVEEFLLSTLDRTATFDAISAALDRLEPPTSGNDVADSPEIVSLAGGMTGISPRDGIGAAFAALRAATPDVYAAASFWWTTGGDDFPALALACRGLPDPYRYKTLLTGKPDEISHAP